VTTEQELDALTDYGLFEKLSVAVLRAANPEYHRLIHVGMNADGRTIPSSVDALVPPAAGTKMVVAACATTARNRLRDKWLRPDIGDVPKAIASVHEFRRVNPLQKAVLVLCTNRTPDERLVCDVGTACLAALVELDIWDRSRIAAFLDHSPAGQWLRRDMLGITASQLSAGLLRCLGNQCLVRYAARIPNSALLTERQDERVVASRVEIPGLTLLCGASGSGKTATCLRVMRARFDCGTPVIWLPETVLKRELDLEAAIRNALAEFHGAPLYGDPLQSIGGAPLLIIVDDLAACRDPIRALEKVFGWCESAMLVGSAADGAKRPVHILVPIWPQFLFGVRSDRVRRLMSHVIDLRPLETAEAVALYRRRSSDDVVVNATLTDEEVRSVVERLGCDPLLIDLYGAHSDHMARAVDQTGGLEYVPEKIVWSWIEREILNISQQTGVPAKRYNYALRRLGMGMLRARTFAPDAIELAQFLGDRIAVTDTSYADVIAVIAARTILRWNVDGGEERLSFRHDRVRDALLIQVLCEVIDAAPDDEILGDPYYCDLLGHVLIRRKFRRDDLQLLSTVAPLALFSALKGSGQADRPSNEDLMEAIFDLLRSQEPEHPLSRAFVFKASELLADTCAPEVRSICDELPASSHWITEALVRNGCVESAMEFVRICEISSVYPRRERLISHAAQRHAEFIPTIVRLLSQPDTDSEDRCALLLLAGYIGRVELESAVEVSVSLAPPSSPQEIESALWAVTQCCRDKLQIPLDVVFSNWVQLPQRFARVVPADGRVSRETRLMACDSLIDMGGLTLAKRLPRAAIPTLIQCAARQPKLSSEINLFLCLINDPQASSYVVRQSAMAMRSDGAAASRIYLDLKGRTDLQSLRDDEGEMTTTSQRCLEAIWMADTEPIEDRRVAYLLWRARARTEDLCNLERVPPQDAMAAYVLGDRVRLGDKSAFSAFLEEINQCAPQQLAVLWMNAQGVMDEQLARGLDDCLGRHRLFDALARILASLVMELATDIAVPIVCRHWPSLRKCPAFVQAALYLESPVTRALASDAIQGAADRTAILESIVEQFGISRGLYSPLRAMRSPGRRMDLLIPYMDDLSELDLVDLWEGCNELGYFDWRKRHVDKRISKVSSNFLALVDVSADLQARLDELYPEDDFRLGWVASNCLAAGYSLEESFSLIANWAAQGRSPTSLLVAAELFGAEGSRGVLPLFDQLVNGSEQTAQLREAVHFAVKVRTLV
jgi:hypothetical protein